MSPLPSSPTDAAPRAITPAASRRADARRNREAILRAADSLLLRDGWEASMQEIAAASGVGIGTVYRHFASKQVLLGALIAQRFDDARARVEELTSGDGAAFTRLGRALRVGAAVVAADPLIRLATSGAGPQAWEYAEASRMNFDAAFGPLIADAHRESSLRRDVDVDDVGLLMKAVCATIEEAHPQRWQHLLDIVIDGLRARYDT